jgi:hypothetical protein
MNDALLMAELAQSCRLLACHQQNPVILDMLHDLEEDFEQQARDIDRGKRPAGYDEPLRQEKEPLRVSFRPRFS